MTEWKFCPECATKLVEQEGQPGEVHPTCPEGHFTFYNNPDVSATGIIEREDGKYLVLFRNIEPSKGKPELPGGFLNAGEGAEEAFIRELKEETGLEIEIVEYLGSFPSVYGETGIETVNVGYLAKVVGGEWTLSDEAKRAEWVDRDGFPKMAHADDQATVESFLNRAG